jgi:hypothetical protein
MRTAIHRTKEELEAGLHEIFRAPREVGSLEMIVRRPAIGEREVILEAQLDAETGLVGDGWFSRGSGSTADGKAHPDMQLNVMNARVVSLLASTREHWSLAGDQFYVDFDLSVENLPVGARLSIGSAVIEVTAPPHTGCGKFAQRFGAEATRFVNSPMGKQFRFRGLNAKIVQPGVVHAGDAIKKV